MKRVSILFAYLSLTLCASAFDLGVTNHTRFVFAGDSITDAKRYTHYIAAYLIDFYPQFTIHAQTEGRGGAAIQELITPPDDRYMKAVYPYQSQASNMVVFLCSGLSGGTPTNIFMSNLWVVVTNYIIGSNSALPVLVGEKPQNTASGSIDERDINDAKVYVGQTGGWPNANIWRALTNVWLLPVQMDGVDDTHPGPGGHIMEAYMIIKLLGLETNVSSATLNGSAATITSTNHCVISSLSSISGGISFVRLDDRLPWAVDEAGRALAESLLPEIATWQNYGLTVSGLTAGTYDIAIDGSLVATATHTQLAAGVNMSTWHQGPIHNQLQEVLGRIRDCHWVDRVTLADRPNPAQGVQKYKSNAAAGYNTFGYRGTNLINYLQPALTQIQNFDALIHTAAQPVARTFTIVKQSSVVAPVLARTSRGLLFAQ